MEHATPATFTGERGFVPSVGVQLPHLTSGGTVRDIERESEKTMAAKLTRTKVTYVVEVSTKVLFTDEYDPEYRVVPTSAEVSTVDGKLDKIELIGDDESGIYTVALIRDHGRLSAHQRKVIAQILAACGVVVLTEDGKGPCPHRQPCGRIECQIGDGN